MSYNLFCDYMELNMLIPDDEMTRELALAMYNKYLSKISPKQYERYIIQWKSEQLMKNQPQLFTFTTNPEHKDLKAQEAYICGILKRKNNLNISKLSYTIEHIDTNLHFHVMIVSSKQIPINAFKQYVKNYGTVFKSKLGKNGEKDIDPIQDYLNKENQIITLL